jgi:hypothetical protein
MKEKSSQRIADLMSKVIELKARIRSMRPIFKKAKSTAKRKAYLIKTGKIAKRVDLRNPVSKKGPGRPHSPVI